MVEMLDGLVGCRVVIGANAYDQEHVAVFNFFYSVAVPLWCAEHVYCSMAFDQTTVRSHGACAVVLPAGQFRQHVFVVSLLLLGCVARILSNK
jgi:hypothetical protein